jgi:hypothetical protein
MQNKESDRGGVKVAGQLFAASCESTVNGRGNSQILPGSKLRKISFLSTKEPRTDSKIAKEGLPLSVGQELS